MKPYRSKPKTVMADQYWPGKNVEGVRYRTAGTYEDLDGLQSFREGPYVVTKQGQAVSISPGEWVIRERDGSGYYPCDPDEFKALYEPVT